MLIKVDGDNVEVIRHTDMDKPKVVCTLERVKDELEDFLSYKCMAKDNQTKYNTVSMQEFQHMLIALDDFFTELHTDMNPQETVEFDKFIKSFNTPTK